MYTFLYYLSAVVSLLFICEQVIYRLDADSENDAEKFTVNTVDGKGVLRLVGDLDYERKSLYQLRVSDQPLHQTHGLGGYGSYAVPSFTSCLFSTP